MKKTTGTLIVFISFLLIYQNVIGQGYEIKFKIKNLSNDSIILGHHFNEKLIPDDTVVVNSNGEGVFKGKEALAGGMYFVFLPTKKYFDIFISDNQKFYFENDTTEFLDNLKFTDSKENDTFIDYQRFLQNLNKEAKKLTEEKEKFKEDKDKVTKLNAQLQSLNGKVTTKIKSIIDENSNMLFAKFLKATQEIQIPTEVPNNKKFYYYRDHFFDNFDVSDERLLRTPIYENKINQFLNFIQRQPPDSIKPSLDMLINRTSHNKELVRFMLIHVFNHYASSNIMGNDALFVYVAKNYYTDTKLNTWSDSAFIAETNERWRKKEPIILGKKMQNIKMLHVPYSHLVKSIEDSLILKKYFFGEYITMHSIQAKYTIMMFWESDCSHCKTAVPLLHKIYQRLKNKGVKVVSFNMLSGEEGKLKWAKFVKKHTFNDWINVWDPSYQSEYKHKFNIESSPVLFLLDKDKKIIAKRIGPEQAEEIILDFSLDEELVKDENKDKKMQVLKSFVDSYDTKEGLEVIKKVVTRRVTTAEKTEIEKYIQEKAKKYSGK